MKFQEARVSKPVFLLMPEWQGSASSRALQLAEGAAILREDLPRSALHEVAVPLEAGDALGTPIARLSSVLQARDAARRTLTEAEGTPIIVGGDCATSLPGLEAAVRKHGDSLAVLWFDAHPDLQHPDTSPSGSASGMTLRHALGGGSPDLAASDPIAATQLTLIGAREIDAEEQSEIEQRQIFTLPVIDPDNPDLAVTVTERLRGLGASHVYIHLDLDVLDPAEFSAVHVPVPFGLSVAEVTAAIRAAVSMLPLAGASICEFAPADASMASEDLPTVLRLLGALTSGSKA